MYNWSVDEKKFKKKDEVINFLRKQPEVILLREESKKDQWDNSVIRVIFDSNIHPARKVFLGHHLAERMGNLHISIVEE